MTENNTDAQNQAQNQVIPIAINSQYIKDLSFENPNAPNSFLAVKAAPNVDVNVNVEAKKANEELFEVTLHIKATAKAENNVIFIAELSYAALTTIKGIPDESLRPVLLIEIPRLLFPFARNIMADLTRDGGYPPLMINPVDFVSLYRKGMEDAERNAKQAQGNA